jgi:hypothetical protein
MKKLYIFIFCILLLQLIFITILPTPFIGEDSLLVNLSWNARPLSDFIPVVLSLDGIITYGTQDLYYIAYTFYSLIGNHNIWRFKLLNMVILAINYFFLWLWFKKTDEHTNALWPLAAIIFFTFSVPVWQIMAVHSGAPGVTQNLFTAIALFTYFFYYRTTESRIKQILSFAIIIFFTRMAVILKGEGRLVFVVIFLYLFACTCYLILKERKTKKQFPSFTSFPLFKTKNIILLAVLFILCLPFIAVILTLLSIDSQDAIGSQDTVHYVHKTDILYTYFPILYALRPVELGEGFIHSDYGFYWQLFLKMLQPWKVYGFLTVVTIIISLGICYLTSRQNKKSNESASSISHLCLFSGIWFIMTLSAIEVMRGLTGVHWYYNWQIIDFYSAMFPGSIFVISCVWNAYTCVSSVDKQTLYKRILAFLLVLLLIVKIITLLTWSGGFLDYFVGFFDAAQFIREEYGTNNAAVAIFHQGPKYVYGGSTLLRYHFPAITSIEAGCPKESDLNSIVNDKGYYQKRQTLFILSNEPIDQTCNNVRLLKALAPRDTSFYYFIKNEFGLSKKTYIYQHIYDENEK